MEEKDLAEPLILEGFAHPYVWEMTPMWMALSTHIARHPRTSFWAGE